MKLSGPFEDSQMVVGQDNMVGSHTGFRFGRHLLLRPVGMLQISSYFLTFLQI